MKIKTFVFFLTILFFTFACKEKTNIDIFNKFHYMHAVPVTEGSLPFNIFTEEGKMYVQYIKNGKPLDKIDITYSHSDLDEYGDVIYYFKEVSNSEKNGIYRIIDNEEDYSLQYIPKNQDTISYFSTLHICKDCIEINSENPALAEKQLSILKGDSEDYLYDYGLAYIQNLAYLINTNPKTLTYTFPILSQESDEAEMPPLNIMTSTDGNLRFYQFYYRLEGNGPGSVCYDIIAQFRDNDHIHTINNMEYAFIEKGLPEADYLYTDDIKLHTVYLDNKTYYIVNVSVHGIFDFEGESAYGYQYHHGNILQIYSIENGELITNKIFNTTKKKTDHISIEYEEPEEDELEYYNMDRELFDYDEKSKTISAPLIDGLSLTDKYLLYQWDGTHFTYKGIKTK